MSMVLRTVLLLLLVSNGFCELNDSDDENFQNSDKRRLEKESEIISSLLRGYDPLIRPVGNVLYEKFNRPVIVKMDIYIRNIPRVDDLKMEFDTDISLRQTWKDERLAYSKEGPDMVTIRELDKIWKPDTFIGTEVSAQRHMIDQANSLLRVKRDGTVKYSTRFFITSFCAMQFSDFPFDNQTCDLNFESYGFTQDDIVYTWEEDVGLDKGVQHDIPLFELTNVTYEGGQVKTMSGDIYSFLRVVFHFQRKFGHYQHQLITPIMMLVTVSWAAFFIHPSKVTARVFLGVSVLLTLFGLAAFLNVGYPKTAYVRAVDIWIGVSLFFVFQALIVTIMVTYFYVEKEKGCGADGAPGDTEEHLITTPGGKWNARKRQKSFQNRIHDTLERHSLKADAMSRILFPVLHTLFVIIFFIVYAIF